MDRQQRLEALRIARQRGLLSQKQSAAVQELERRGIGSGGQMNRRMEREQQSWTLGRAFRSANLATMGVPVVNDLAGLLDDSYMYLTEPESRTWGNAAMSAAGALPFVPSAAGIIAGKGAKTLKPETVQLAETMRDAGASRDEIWKATGEATGQPAFFDERGQLKFEIDDSQSALTDLAEQKLAREGDDARYVGWQEEGFSHQKLYESYPDVKDIDLSINNNPRAQSGFHTPKTSGDEMTFGRAEEIGIDSLPSEARRINLHELQHGVQGREGFATGGSPSQFRAEADLEDFRELETDDILNRMENQFSVEAKIAAQNPNNETYIAAMEKYSGDPLIGNADPEVKILEYIKDTDPQYNRIYRENTSLKYRRMSPLDKYKRLAGEAESRAVEARRDMPMLDRINKPFWESYDVPEDEFIYRYD
jgi:hypothetical protein